MMVLNRLTSTSLPYKPNSQGQVERFNQILKRMLYSHFTATNKKNWIDVLKPIMKNYNEAISTVTGYKPNEVHYSEDKEMRDGVYCASKVR